MKWFSCLFCSRWLKHFDWTLFGVAPQENVPDVPVDYLLEQFQTFWFHFASHIRKPKTRGLQTSTWVNIFWVLRHAVTGWRWFETSVWLIHTLTYKLILSACFHSKQILRGSFHSRFLGPGIALDFSKRWSDFLRGGDALRLVNGVTSAAGAFLPDVKGIGGSQGERIRATCEDYRVSALRYRAQEHRRPPSPARIPAPLPEPESREADTDGGRSTALVGAEVASPGEGIRTWAGKGCLYKMSWV